VDSQTKVPIPYVNIGILSSISGTVSDAAGKFEIQAKTTSDSIVLSSVGYETRRVSLNSISERMPVFLDPIDYEIEAIEISNYSFDETVILGVRNEEGRGASFGFGSPQLGTEIGAPIKITKETFIKSVNFALNHAKGDSLLFRINIYAFNDGQVGEKVLKENIYLIDKQRKGDYSIDLSEYGIILKEDVLLSLEWLRNFDEIGNKSITFDTKKSKSPKGTYIRYSSNSAFKRLPFKKKYKPCLYFVGKQSSNEKKRKK
jgi:hypothetical protein